jgi:hypothetical protein
MISHGFLLVKSPRPQNVMSDINITEILTEVYNREKNEIHEEEVILEAPTPLKEKKSGQPKNEWIHTRSCWCPFDAETDCRFHPMTEPGWEVCPHKGKPGTKARSLYINRGEPKGDAELSIGADIKDLTPVQEHGADKYLK